MTKHPYSEKMDINNNGFSNIDEELQSLQKLLFYQIGSDLLPKTKTLPDISWELKTQPCLKTMTPMCRTVKVSPASSSDTLPLTPEAAGEKPPYHFSELVELALKDKEFLTVSEIYEWIMMHFTYYRMTDESRWKPAVRHTLTTNQAFYKARKVQRGFLWGYKKPVPGEPVLKQIPYSLDTFPWKTTDNQRDNHWKKQKLVDYDTKSHDDKSVKKKSSPAQKQTNYGSQVKHQTSRCTPMAMKVAASRPGRQTSRCTPLEYGRKGAKSPEPPLTKNFGSSSQNCKPVTEQTKKKSAVKNRERKIPASIDHINHNHCCHGLVHPPGVSAAVPTIPAMPVYMLFPPPGSEGVHTPCLAAGVWSDLTTYNGGKVPLNCISSQLAVEESGLVMAPTPTGSATCLMLPPTAASRTSSTTGMMGLDEVFPLTDAARGSESASCIGSKVPTT